MTDNLRAPRPLVDEPLAFDEADPLNAEGRQPTGDGDAALLGLFDTCVDAERGFATMVDKAEPEFRDTAERFRALHDRHAALLRNLLSDRGLEPDSEGSFMGNVNEMVVTVRAFFDDIDADVMAQVRDGESRVLGAFDRAIAAPLLGPEAMMLRRLRDELTALLHQTRSIG